MVLGSQIKQEVYLLVEMIFKYSFSKIDFIQSQQREMQQDFGDLTGTNDLVSNGALNSIRGCFAGGRKQMFLTNIMSLNLLQLHQQEMQQILVI